VSLKVQVSELVVVLALELDKPVVVVLLLKAMPPEMVQVAVAVQVVAIMAGQPAVEAPDLDPVTEDTIDLRFFYQARTGAQHTFLVLPFYYSTSVNLSLFLCFSLGSQ
jgi:hypothetical protein